MNKNYSKRLNRIKKAFSIISEDDYKKNEITSDITETDYDDLEVSPMNFSVMKPDEVNSSRKLSELLKHPYIVKRLSDPKVIAIAVNYGPNPNDGSLSKYLSDNAEKLAEPLKANKFYAKLYDDVVDTLKYMGTKRDNELVGDNRGLFLIDLADNCATELYNTSIIGSKPTKVVNKFVYSVHFTPGNSGLATSQKLAKYVVFTKNGMEYYKTYIDARLGKDKI